MSLAGRQGNEGRVLPISAMLCCLMPPDNDVDVLVTFEPDARCSLFDLTTMQQELADAFGRPVDLVEEAALRNPFRRLAILRAKQTLYAAAYIWDMLDAARTI